MNNTHTKNNHHKPNSSAYDTNSSVKVQNSSLNAINSSLISDNINMLAKPEIITKNFLANPYKKNDVTPVITHFLVNYSKVITPSMRMFGHACHRLNTSNFVIHRFTSNDDKRYYKDLSKNVSGQAGRYLLAFFVPDNSAASQAVTIQSSTTLRAHLSVSRGYSLISIASHLLTDYDGLTLQNKRVFGRICRAVTNVTESKTRHPIPLPYRVALTQKTLGGHHFA